MVNCFSVYIIRVMQDFSADPKVVQDLHSDYRADFMVVQYSAEPRVVQL